LRLAFNTTALLSPLTGVGQYCFNLAKGLLTKPDLTVDFFYGAFWDSQLRSTPLPHLATALPWLRRHVPYSYELRRWLQNYRFAQYAGRQTPRQEFNIYHEPNFLPLKFTGPTVITVHDLSWIRYPDTHPAERVKAMNRYFEPSLMKADAIITCSAFVKQELVDVFGVSEDLISVTPLGVEDMFVPQTPPQTRSILDKYKLAHGHYFLAVGTLEPRKNLVLTLRAYQQLPSKIRNSYPLVLIGMQGWGTSALEHEIEPLVRSGEVLKLGYLPRTELATLMAGASALLYPSIYEGFGLPPLEAMACGLPVICSNSSSLPEVVSDAGILIDSHSENQVSAALLRLIEDDSWREDISRRAIQRARELTWQKCVDRTLDVYRSVAP
jgi:glycosyltransferase involved in cell wall biosynthesis